MATNKLSDAKVRALKTRERPFKVSDGGGLHLLVTPAGGKLWRLAYRFGGKQKLLAFGAYPTVGLSEAREERDRCKVLLHKQVDPSEARRLEKLGRTAPEELTFRGVGKRWHAAHAGAWSQSYASRIWSRVDDDLCSQFGDVTIASVDSAAVLAALRRIETRGAVETAKRVRDYARDIFRFAKAEKLIEVNPAEDLKDALRASPPAKRRASLRAVELPDFLAKLQAYDGEPATKLALRLALLTFVRTNEIRFAQWAEFERLDTPHAIWRIPALRMKMRNEHIVPLSAQALQVLVDLRGLAAGSSYVFPAQTKAGVMSENTMLFALYRLGYRDQATVHGFRGTASTILNEHGFNRDWIERQLAHVEQDQVRAAYNTAEWLQERRQMMQWWADYLDRTRGGPSGNAGSESPTA